MNLNKIILIFFGLLLMVAFGGRVKATTLDFNNNNKITLSNNNQFLVAETNVDYENICNNEGISTVFTVLGYFVQIVRWLVPIVIIFLGIIDFSKAVISSDEKSTKNALNSLFRRLIIGILIFVLPNIIMAILNIDVIKDLLQDSRFSDCLKILFNIF